VWQWIDEYLPRIAVDFGALLQHAVRDAGNVPGHVFCHFYAQYARYYVLFQSHSWSHADWMWPDLMWCSPTTCTWLVVWSTELSRLRPWRPLRAVTQPVFITITHGYYYQQ
jgi:hypothetical protein